VSCSLTHWKSCVTGLLGKSAGAVAESAFTAIANDFGDAAKDATNWLWQTMDAATAVRLGGPGWAADLGITVALALIVGTGLFLIQVISSALRRDMGGMGRALRGLVVAFVAGGAAIAVTDLLLAATDALANGIMVAGTGSRTWSELGQRIVAATAISNIAAPAVLLMISLIVVMASVIVWAALMVRKMLLIISAVFSPVAFAGGLSDFTASWVRKWIEFTVALVTSKVILVVIFVVGLGVLDNGLGETPTSPGLSHGAQSITQLVIGCLILAMAGFAPWMALKLVHFVGDHYQHIGAHAAAAQSAGQQAVAAPQKLMSKLNGHSSGGGSGSATQADSSGQTQPKSGADTSSDGGLGGAVGDGAAGGGADGSGTGGSALAGPALAEVGAGVEGAVAAKALGQQQAAQTVGVIDQQQPQENDAASAQAPPDPQPGNGATPSSDQGPALASPTAESSSPDPLSTSPPSSDQGPALASPTAESSSPDPLSTSPPSAPQPPSPVGGSKTPPGGATGASTGSVSNGASAGEAAAAAV
jgi:type IV secretion system protein TrbL